MSVIALPNQRPEAHTGKELTERLAAAVAQVNTLVLGKPQQIRLAFACMLAGGHLLLEDIPGTGKTILARALAATLDLSFKRVQFTSDLMPSDILGVSIYQANTNTFELHKGPIFTHILLADEINRATPRAQSALLEGMAEGQVSIDQDTIRLPHPFLVIATQNPIDLMGTFALPQAQKDRFLFQVAMGYPDREHEMALMRGQRRQVMLDNHQLRPQLSQNDMLELMEMRRNVQVSEVLIGFAYDLVQATREHAQIEVGLSTRACLALMEASSALALLSGREYVIPEDIQEAFMPLACHRISLRNAHTTQANTLIGEIIANTPVP